MSRAWNHPSFQEIERQLPLLRIDAPRFYRAVVGTFVCPRFVRRAVSGENGQINQDYREDCEIN